MEKFASVFEMSDDQAKVYLKQMEREDRKLKAKISRKMTEVRRGIDKIEKKGRNSFLGYDYVREKEVVEKIRRLFYENGLDIQIQATDFREIEKGENIVTLVELEYEIIDIESGYSITKSWYGYGEDPRDKGLYKAFTSGNKYFLLKTFQIPTTDDVENEEMTPEKIEKARKNKTENRSYNCEECGKEISDRVFKFSISKYNKPLCREHQRPYQKAQ